MRKIIIFYLLFAFSHFPLFGQDVSEQTTLVFPAFLHTYGIRKATRFHLFVFTKNRTHFDNPQGLAVVRLAAWEDSTTENDDDEVTVYGVNSGENCIIYNTSMTSLGIYGLDEKGSERLNRPQGIAADKWGNVYVADAGNHRIVKLFNPGHSLHFVRSVGSKGKIAGKFLNPQDVALDAKSNVYVADSGNNRVQIFDSSLVFIRELKVDVRNPAAIAVADRDFEWTFFKENFIVLIDSNRSRIRQFDFSGNLLHEISAKKFFRKSVSLCYLALDYYNNIYATDIKNHCIHKFDHNLKYLTTFGKKGTGKNEFLEPRGITIHRHLGQVFIAEKWGAQYFWIGTDCRDFKIEKDFSNERILNFSYFLTEPSYVTANILDEKKNYLFRLWKSRFRFAGEQKERWNGTIFRLTEDVRQKLGYPISRWKKQQLPPGVYFLQLKIEPTYSAYHYFEKTMTLPFEIQ